MFAKQLQSKLSACWLTIVGERSVHMPLAAGKRFRKWAMCERFRTSGSPTPQLGGQPCEQAQEAR